MPEHRIAALGLTLAFQAEASPERVDKARRLLEERFAELEKRGTMVSKEKLLVFLSLGLADDYLQSEKKLTALETKAKELLGKIDRLETKSD